MALQDDVPSLLKLVEGGGEGSSREYPYHLPPDSPNLSVFCFHEAVLGPVHHCSFLHTCDRTPCAISSSFPLSSEAKNTKNVNPSTSSLKHFLLSSTPLRKVSSPQNLVLDSDTEVGWSFSMATPTCQQKPNGTPLAITTDEESTTTADTTCEELLLGQKSIEKKPQNLSCEKINSRVALRHVAGEKPLARALFPRHVQGTPKLCNRDAIPATPMLVKRTPLPAQRLQFDPFQFSPIPISPLVCSSQSVVTPHRQAGDYSMSLLGGPDSVLETPKSVPNEKVGGATVSKDFVGKEVCVSCSQELFGSPEMFSTTEQCALSRIIPVEEKETAFEGEKGGCATVETGCLKSSADFPSHYRQREPVYKGGVSQDQFRTNAGLVSQLQPHADEITTVARTPIQEAICGTSSSGQRQDQSDILDLLFTGGHQLGVDQSSVSSSLRCVHSSETVAGVGITSSAPVASGDKHGSVSEKEEGPQLCEQAKTGLLLDSRKPPPDVLSVVSQQSAELNKDGKTAVVFQCETDSSEIMDDNSSKCDISHIATRQTNREKDERDMQDPSPLEPPQHRPLDNATESGGKGVGSSLDQPPASKRRKPSSKTFLYPGSKQLSRKTKSGRTRTIQLSDTASRPCSTTVVDETSHECNTHSESVPFGPLQSSGLASSTSRRRRSGVVSTALPPAKRICLRSATKSMGVEHVALEHPHSDSKQIELQVADTDQNRAAADKGTDGNNKKDHESNLPYKERCNCEDIKVNTSCGVSVKKTETETVAVSQDSTATVREVTCADGSEVNGMRTENNRYSTCKTSDNSEEISGEQMGKERSANEETIAMKSPLQSVLERKGSVLKSPSQSVLERKSCEGGVVHKRRGLRAPGLRRTTRKAQQKDTVEADGKEPEPSPQPGLDEVREVPQNVDNLSVVPCSPPAEHPPPAVLQCEPGPSGARAGESTDETQVGESGGNSWQSGSESQLQATAGFVGFQTAGGKAICVSERAMERARKLVSEEMEETPSGKRAQATTLLQPLTANVKPTDMHTTKTIPNFTTPKTDPSTSSKTPSSTLPTTRNNAPSSSTSLASHHNFHTPSIATTATTTTVHALTVPRRVVSAKRRSSRSFKAPRKASSVSKGEEQASVARILRNFRMGGAVSERSGAKKERESSVKTEETSVKKQGVVSSVVESGFSTAGGRKLSISVTAMQRAQEFISEDKENEISSTHTASTVQSVSPFHHGASSSSSDQLAGFTTASGKGISISAAALERAQSIVSGVELDTQSLDDDGVKEPGTCPAEAEWQVVVGFQTASGHSMRVSSHSLAKAEALVASVPSESDSRPPVHCDRLSGEMTGFQTAGGRGISVSSRSLQSAQKLIEADPDYQSLSLQLESGICGNKPSLLTGFQTAGGKQVSVAAQSLQRAESLLELEHVPIETHLHEKPESADSVQNTGDSALPQEADDFTDLDIDTLVAFTQVGTHHTPKEEGHTDSLSPTLCQISSITQFENPVSDCEETHTDHCCFLSTQAVRQFLDFSSDDDNGDSTEQNVQLTGCIHASPEDSHIPSLSVVESNSKSGSKEPRSQMTGKDQSEMRSSDFITRKPCATEDASVIPSHTQTATEDASVIPSHRQTATEDASVIPSHRQTEDASVIPSHTQTATDVTVEGKGDNDILDELFGVTCQELEPLPPHTDTYPDCTTDAEPTTTVSLNTAQVQPNESDQVCVAFTVPECSSVHQSSACQEALLNSTKDSDANTTANVRSPQVNANLAESSNSPDLQNTSITRQSTPVVQSFSTPLQDHQEPQGNDSPIVQECDLMPGTMLALPNTTQADISLLNEVLSVSVLDTLEASTNGSKLEEARGSCENEIAEPAESRFRTQSPSEEVRMDKDRTADNMQPSQDEDKVGGSAVHDYGSAPPPILSSISPAGNNLHVMTVEHRNLTGNVNVSVCDLPSVFPGLQTASGKQVQVSEQVLSAVRHVLNSTSDGVSLNCSASSGSSGFGLQTAIEEPMSVSQPALLDAKNVLDEGSVARKNTACMSFPGLQTASGKSVEVSEESLSKVRMILDAELPPKLEEDNQLHVRKSHFPGLQTASGHKVEISESSMQAAKRVVHGEEQTDSLHTGSTRGSTSFPGLQTASGHPVHISESAMQAARRAIHSENESGSGVSGLTATKGDKGVISETALKVKFGESGLIGAQPAQDRPTFSGLMTAGGGTVHISESALQAARRALGSEGEDTASHPSSPQESTAKVEKQAFSGLQTAGGQKIEISESSLQAARKAIHEDLSSRETISTAEDDPQEPINTAPSHPLIVPGGPTSSSQSSSSMARYKPTFSTLPPSASSPTAHLPTASSNDSVSVSGGRYKPVFSAGGSRRGETGAQQQHQQVASGRAPTSTPITASTSTTVTGPPGLLSTPEGMLWDRATPPSHKPFTPVLTFLNHDGSYISATPRRRCPSNANAGRRLQHNHGQSNRNRGQSVTGAQPPFHSTTSASRRLHPPTQGTPFRKPDSISFQQPGYGARSDNSSLTSSASWSGPSFYSTPRQRKDTQFACTPVWKASVTRKRGSRSSSFTSHQISSTPYGSNVTQEHSMESKAAGSYEPSSQVRNSETRACISKKHSSGMAEGSSVATTTLGNDGSLNMATSTQVDNDGGSSAALSVPLSPINISLSQLCALEEPQTAPPVAGKDDSGYYSRNHTMITAGKSQNGGREQQSHSKDRSCFHSPIPEIPDPEFTETAKESLNDSLEEEYPETDTNESEVLNPFAPKVSHSRTCQPRPHRSVTSLQLPQKSGPIKPQTGSLLAARLQNQRTPLLLAVGRRLPGRHTHEELYSQGVHPSVVAVSISNAADFHFSGGHYFSSAVLNGAPVCVGDGAVLRLQEGGAGVGECWEAFVLSPGVDPKLISFEWFANHYKWVVWKLAALEVAFPGMFAGRCLTPDWLMLQMKYRYDREIDHAERSAIRKICERDDTPARTMVLCVSQIHTDSRNESTGDGKGLRKDNSKLEQSHAFTPPCIELTDGWYSLPAILDPPLKGMIRCGKITIGTKLMIYGAELTGDSEACHPLEAPGNLALKISANSTRRAQWHAKLGYQRLPHPFPVSLASLYPDGGLVGCTEVIVARVYPLLCMEKRNEGRSVFRNRRAEERVASSHEALRQRKIEKICARVEREFEEEMTKGEGGRVTRRRSRRLNSLQIKQLQDGEEIYHALTNSPDPHAFQELLSRTQCVLLESYCQTLRSQRQSELQSRIREAIEEAEDQLPPTRNVVPLLRVRLVPVGPASSVDCQLSVWRPGEEVRGVLSEGKALRVFNLSATPSRSKQQQKRLQLTASRSTRYEQITLTAPMRTNYSPRECVDIGRWPLTRPFFGEFDTVGVVVCHTSTQLPAGESSTRQVDTVYLSNAEGKLLAIKVWDGLKVHALEDVVVPGAKLAVSNLSMRGQGPAHPLASAGDRCSFSLHPREPHLKLALEELGRTLPNKMADFLHSLEEEIEELL